MLPVWRVSHLAAYERWKAMDSEGIGWLHQSIFSEESTEAMNRGTAFHSALEKAVEGEYDTVEAIGYTFAFTCSAEISLPKTREIRRNKDYGGIIVSGQCDGIEGKLIIDHKSIEGSLDAEHYIDGWQYRFYLDIFEADRFDWHVWEMNELRDEPRCYEVYAHHLLTQYRYPALEEDCRLLAIEFRDFTRRVGWEEKMIRKAA
jgi:hypothetical protein